MSIRTCVARAFCAVLAAGAVSVPGSAAGMDGSRAAEAKRGLLVGRPSRETTRIWRDIEGVVGASDPSGAPRSPTLRRLWEWARASAHVIRVEMVSPSRLPRGVAGVFRVERVDPAGQSHVAVIRLCPWNIRHAKAAQGPNAVESFVRFQGLTQVERYAEVLAHELAHAEYYLESPHRLAQLVAAESAIDEFLSRAGRGTGPAHHEVGSWCAAPLAVLAAGEAHAESVEAVVLRELAGTRSSPISIEQRVR